jgi:hypothetical protein
MTEKNVSGEHFGARGYAVSSGGLEEGLMKKHIHNQVGTYIATF